jgi:hypothetical protein
MPRPVGAQRQGSFLNSTISPRTGVSDHVIMNKFGHCREWPLSSPKALLLPRRGNAYQPRVKPWECHAPTSRRSEGTPHIHEKRTHGRTIPMRRSFRTLHFYISRPRVSPWAGMQRPVGAQRRSVFPSLPNLMETSNVKPAKSPPTRPESGVGSVMVRWARTLSWW